MNLDLWICGSKIESKPQVRALERQNAALRQSKPPIEPSVTGALERATEGVAPEREAGGVSKEESSDIMEARWFLSAMSFPGHLLTFSPLFFFNL